MKTILDTIVLPGTVSDFERRYLERMNRIGLIFFLLHVPVMVLIAWLNDTGPLAALLIGLGIVAGPTIAYFTLERPRWISAVYGFTSMLMGGLLVHVGQGPVQIEMHFYFFALLAMLAVYGNPMVIVVASVTVALHHLVLWLVLPTSVFNYAAPIWVVAVHAAFVVLEAIATCFIARSFFDNVIGLERIVTERTRELDGRNMAMRLVLDNVRQGFVTVDLAGKMSAERSAVVSRWLGDASGLQTFADYLAAVCPDTADGFRLAWTEVVEQTMPLELTLEQLPKRFASGEQQFRLEYVPIMAAGGGLERVLIVMSDVSAEVARERLESAQREVVQAFERVVRDKAGFLEFFDESTEQVKAIAKDEIKDSVMLTRVIHTLKGNAGLFGIQSISDLCHRMESDLVEEGSRPSATARAELALSWDHVKHNLDAVLGGRARDRIEIDEADYETALRAVRGDVDRGQIAEMIASWRLEPTAKRLARVAEQAHAIARRLNKQPLTVDLADHGLRLEAASWAGFWSSFVHLLRNAIDHGLETSDARAAAGKPRAGRLSISTRLAGSEFLVEIADDGRGIDWARVAQVADRKGVPHATPEELVEAVFCDGISTSAYVNEFSGRGVGMGAVRAACQALGGSVTVASTAGHGTRVSFRFPRHMMTDRVPGEPLRAA
jgi:two-component system chemotaxis sensor kinase CheA